MTRSFLVVLGAVLFVTGCQEAEEAGQDSSPTPTATSTATETSPVPTSTPPPISADWKLYSDAGGRFSIRYPSNWFEIDGDLYSADPRGSKSLSLPPEILNVEFTFNPLPGLTGCGGAILIDAQTGQASPASDGTPASLGGLPAWHVTRVAGSGIQEGLTRIERLSLIYQGYCVLVTGNFTQGEPDVTTFFQIASTFELKF